MVREIVRRIQVMRKEMDLPYDQHISVKYDGDDLIREAMKVSVGNIKSETLSDSIENSKFYGDDRESFTKNWDIDGRELKLAIRKM